MVDARALSICSGLVIAVLMNSFSLLDFPLQMSSERSPPRGRGRGITPRSFPLAIVQTPHWTISDPSQLVPRRNHAFRTENPCQREPALPEALSATPLRKFCQAAPHPPRGSAAIPGKILLPRHFPCPHPFG